MRNAFIGIDVCFRQGKHLPVSICTWQDAKLIPAPLRQLRAVPPRGHGNAATLDQTLIDQFAQAAKSYVLDACSELCLNPTRIAIDAPSAPCAVHLPRRAAEQALDAARISCYATPTLARFEAILDKVRAHLERGEPHNRIPHSNQLWMLVGFRLFDVLSEVAECIEVFPQATARVLGAGGVHKSKHGAVEAQLAAAAAYTGWPTGRADEPSLADIGYSPAHDRLDAYVSAWVAALDEEDRIAFGEPPDDVIWVPRIERPRAPVESIVAAPEKRLRRGSSKPSAATDNHTRQCPACDYQFKRWPFGWDAHAAHTCSGLSESGLEERKREYKRRFDALF